MTKEEYNSLSKDERKKLKFNELPGQVKLYGLIFLAIIIIIPALYIRSCNNDYDYPSEDKAYSISQEFVKDYLKAPSTAVFPTEFKFMIEDDKKTYNITSYVESSNSFGVPIRTKFHIRIRYNGTIPNDKNNWELIDFNEIK